MIIYVLQKFFFDTRTYGNSSHPEVRLYFIDFVRHDTSHFDNSTNDFLYLKFLILQFLFQKIFLEKLILATLKIWERFAFNLPLNGKQ